MGAGLVEIKNVDTSYLFRATTRIEILGLLNKNKM
jgi:hypothetical protein